MNLTKRDPRDFQIMCLFSMALYGLIWLKFELNPLWLALIFSTALVTQYAATKIWKLEKFEWKSAAISGLSLCILMRCPYLSLSMALAAITILSKFVIRYKGKHVFNPTNFALVLGILATGVVTVNPGQWGNGPILAFLILFMGSFVANKACRHDVSFAFLLTYATIIIGWVLFTGQDLSVATGRLMMGSLLVFTFFMISDPKTTPDARFTRIAFGISVAAVGAYLQLALKFPPGLLVSLAFLSPLVPLLDHWKPAKRFSWAEAVSK